ncbi:MAG: hypothetical protein ACREBU_07915 [Nitrososphaera sp.]
MIALATASLTGVDNASGSSIAKIQVPELSLRNTLGEKINYLEEGQPVVVRVSIHNQQAVEQSFVVLVEIRNEHGITLYLSTLGSTIAGNGNLTIETSWVPDRACLPETWCSGNHILRSFAVTSLQSPEILSLVREDGDITVIETREGSKLYRLTADYKKYLVEYSIDVGYIKKIGIVNYNAELSILLDAVTTNTELVIQIPEALVADAFSCFGSSLQMDKSLEVYVDSGQIGYVLVQAGKPASWNIPLEAGTRQVEILGGCFA